MRQFWVKQLPVEDVQKHKKSHPEEWLNQMKLVVLVERVYKAGNFTYDVSSFIFVNDIALR